MEMDVIWLLFCPDWRRLPASVGDPQTAHAAGLGVVQFTRLAAGSGTAEGAAYIVLLKIALSTLLIDHRTRARS